MIQEQELKVGNQHILYDGNMQDVKLTSWPYLFESYFLEQHQLITGTAKGRGTTYFFDWESHKLVLRHYLRGGLVGKFNPEFYVNTTLEKTRPYKEWSLLCELQKLGLPAPKPAGMRIVSGGLFYSADLLMHQLEGVTPLCDLLLKGEVEHWQKIGQVIRQFHNEGVYHDDLNCHNILLRGDEVFLIDFDKCAIKPDSKATDSWKNKNLDRLLRSLNKQQGIAEEKGQSLHFSAAAWDELLQAYNG